MKDLLHFEIIQAAWQQQQQGKLGTKVSVSQGNHQNYIKKEFSSIRPKHKTMNT